MKRSDARTLQLGLVIGTGMGALVGEVVALYVLAYLGWPRLFDCLALNILLVIGYSLPGMVLGLAVGHLVNKSKYNVLIRSNREPYIIASVWLAAVCLLFGVLLSPSAIVNAPYARVSFVETFWGMLLWSVAKVLLMLLISVVIGRVFYLVLPRSTRRRSRYRRGKGLGWLLAVCIWPLLLGIVWVYNLNRLPKELSAPALKVGVPVHRVMLIDWDGADWKVIEPLLEQGKMPHLKGVIDRGFYSKVQANRPVLSAQVESDLVTGMAPSHHGVIGNVVYKIPLVRTEFTPPPFSTGVDTMLRTLAVLHLVKRRPVNAMDRRVASIWELAGEAGLKVGVMDGLTTYPTRELEGYQISNYCFPQLMMAFDEESRGMLPREGHYTNPPTVLNELVDDYQGSMTSANDLLQRFVDLKTEELESVFSINTPVQDRPLTYLKSALSQDMFRIRIGRRLWKEQSPDFGYYRLGGLNDLQRQMWQFRQPEKYFGIPEARKQVYGECIEKYYLWLDDELGGLIEDASNDVNLVLVSSHGQGPVFWGWHGKTADFRWGPEGFLVMAGPQVRAGENEKQGEAVAVRDIAPTILYLLGLPLSEELHGSILTQSLSPNLLQQHPAESVARYQLPASVSALESDKAVDRLILRLQRLWGNI